MLIPLFEGKGPVPCEKAPDLFVVDSQDPDAYKKMKTAKAICKTCAYTDQCLQWALDNREVGVYGGTSTRERRKMARRLPSTTQSAVE